MTDEQMREIFKAACTAEPLAEGWPELAKFGNAVAAAARAESREARYRWLRGHDGELTRYSRWRIEFWDDPVYRGVRRLARWWLGRGIPDGPQPCPHCGVRLVRAWAEGVGEQERFFVEHDKPICFAGSSRLEIFPLTQREVRAFRYWTLC